MVRSTMAISPPSGVVRCTASRLPSSAIEETFYDIDRCVSETRAILKQVGEQPKLTVESIEVDGDVATVQFSGSAGGAANFVREQGRWYVPLLNGAEAGEPAGSELPAPTGDGQ